jgi:hypothetical protein
VHPLESGSFHFFPSPDLGTKVLDLVAITPSTVVATCSIHRRIVAGGTTSYRLIPIDIIIGPCPAER